MTRTKIYTVLFILAVTFNLFAIERLNLKALTAQGGAKNSIFAIMWVLVLIGLASSFVLEVFKIQKGEKPDFMGIVWKSVIIILTVQFLPGFLDTLFNALIVNPESAKVDDALNNLFSLISEDKTHKGLVSTQCAALMEEPDFFSITVKFLLSKFWLFGIKFIMLFFLVLAKVSKLILLDLLWPIMFSINLYGFFSSVVYGSFPGGGGIKAVGPFVKSAVTIALWPLIYIIGMELIGTTLSTSLDNVSMSIQCPGMIYFGESVIKAIGSCVFIGIFIKMIPKVAESVVNHSGVGLMAGQMLSAGMAGLQRAGAMAMSAGKKATGGVGGGKSSGGGGGGGGALSGGGKSSGSSAGGAGGVAGLVGKAMQTGAKLTAGEIKSTLGSPSGGKLKDGTRGYSYGQAQSAVDGVSTADSATGKGFQKSLNRAQNMKGNTPEATRAMRTNAVNSVANDAIGYLTGQNQNGDQ